MEFTIGPSGHCVLTLGTPDRENVRWGKINLLPSHCYAVIGERLILSSILGLTLSLMQSSDISDNKEDRTLTILDSWESGSPSTNSRMVLLAFPTYSSPDPRTATFEMSWDEVCKTFEGAYFSWDPATFPHQLSFHGYVLIISLLFIPTNRHHFFQNVGARWSWGYGWTRYYPFRAPDFYQL